MISRMKKLTLVAVKSDIDSITRELVWLSSVDVSPLSDSDSEGLVYEDASARRLENEHDIKQFSDAIEKVAHFGSGKVRLGSRRYTRGEFEHLKSDYEKARSTASEIIEISGEISGLKSEINRRESEITGLRAWERLDAPLNYNGTKNTVFLKGTIPKSIELETVSEEAAEEIDAVLGQLGEDSSFRYIYAVAMLTDREKLLTALSKYGFARATLPDSEMTASETAAKLKEEISLLSQKIADNEEKLRELAKNKELLENAYDTALSESSKLDIGEKLLGTETTCVLQGFIPDYAVKRLSEKLKGYECCCEITEPAEDDDIPVELKNNKFASPFEAILGMYAYPKYGTFDPTFIMGIFYAVIFGMIMQDVGYGLLLLVGCPLLIKLMNAKGTTRKMLSAFMICGITTIIFGLLFGGYFGDAPHQIAVNMLGMNEQTASDLSLLFNPVEKPMNFLIMALAVGAIHLITGMLINAYLLCREGKIFAAIFDIGSWIVLFIGLGLLFLAPSVGKWVAIAGAAMLVLTQGRDSKNPIMKLLKGLYSLYNIISYMSDLLSYSRIFALGLSGAIIGQVMNTLGTLGGGSFVGFIALILIFLVGHTINFALSILSSFVHTARLQYIEFFNKFYVDGGRLFAPASVNTKYSEIIEEAQK